MKEHKNINIKKIKNSNNNKIGILFGTLILLLLLTFSLLRILPIGKFLDDFIFSLLFGWSKYLIYILLYISLIPLCFNYYFKFKASFIWAIIISIICCAWTIETITIISHYDNIWFNNKFDIKLISYYYQSWWNATIINNYHGFFASPIAFENWTIANFFPSYFVGGLIGNSLIAFLGYTTFFVNFILNILIIIISFSWLFFNRPLILFTTVTNHTKEMILEFKLKRKKQKLNKLEKAKANQKKIVLIKNNTNKINNLKKELKVNKEQIKNNKKQIKLKTKQYKENIVENKTKNNNQTNHNPQTNNPSIQKYPNIEKNNNPIIEEQKIMIDKNEEQTKKFIPEQMIINQKYILPTLRLNKNQKMK